MSSATLTDEGGQRPQAAEQPSSSSELSIWHVYALLGLIGAAGAVWVSRNGHPLALILLSAASLAVAFIALMVHKSLAAFWGKGGEVAPLHERRRELLEREKGLVLRSIKELEFDRAMGKIGEVDFAEISTRLRARAVALMQDLDRASTEPVDRPARRESREPRRACAQCGTTNETDARFCKHCGREL
jgi:hypothetical protein